MQETPAIDNETARIFRGHGRSSGWALWRPVISSRFSFLGGVHDTVALGARAENWEIMPY